MKDMVSVNGNDKSSSDINYNRTYKYVFKDPY